MTINQLNFLLELYAYNAYANKLALNAIEKLDEAALIQETSPSHNSVFKLLQHMLECEAFFLSKCRDQDFELDSTSLSTCSGLRRQWRQLEEEQLEFIRTLNAADLAVEKSIEISSQSLVYPVWQLLIQALIHTVHHRGELSILTSTLGCPLPTLDILLYFTEQSGQRWPSQ